MKTDAHKRLTSTDIARLAGVSQATVSRVLQGLPGVREETRRTVLDVIREQNYHPSAAARSMKTSRSNSIAVVVARLSNPLYPQLLQLLSEELHRAGLLMSVWESVPQFEDRLLRSIGEGAVDGVIFATATAAETSLLSRLKAQRPVVLLNRMVDDDAFDQVSSNNEAGGAAVAQYFVREGRQMPGLITGPVGASTIREREKGYRAHLLERHVPLPDTGHIRASEYTYQCGYEAAQALLSMDARIDAVFCTNDVLAIGAVDGLRAMGRRVPQDVWVVGYDDIPMAHWRAINLSTVRQPLKVMTEVAVSKLLARLEGETGVTERVLLHNDLVIRGTSG
jgi:LacI family transcriptional regulator